MSQNTVSGAFITLYDLDSLKLYLARGLYGFLMPPIFNEIGPRSKHYNVLADYACLRRDDHIFFFIKRKIIYGGQVLGSNKIGAFFVNGPYSPLGKRNKCGIFWDEGQRDCYQRTDQRGIFIVPEIGERCQPYLIIFGDKLGLKGNYISSDDLYWRLGNYSFPLPSNSILGMGFCILTPCETKIALDILKNEPRGKISIQTKEKIFLDGNPCPFQTNMLGIKSLNDAYIKNKFVNEAQIEASIIANPNLLIKKLQPTSNMVICRQIPISPFKPANMDRADICYYSQDFSNGSIPKTIIELKKGKGNQKAIDQVVRYLDWIYRITGSNIAKLINAYIIAPTFTRNVCIEKYKDQISLIQIC